VSGIVGLFSTRATDRSVATAMLSATASRGDSAQREVRHDRGSFLGVTRFDWELGTDFSGPALLVEDDELTIAADASLYYRDDLRRLLSAAGVTPTGDTPSHLILAAYRAWGEECAARLEGDFAFVIWNRASGLVFAARDFVGRRPLYFAEWGGTLAIGSTIGAILAHPGCPQDLNLTALGALTAGLNWSAGIDTCYHAIQVLRPGHRLIGQQDQVARIAAFWTPFVRTEEPQVSFDEAAEELRALLTRATTERFANQGTTSIWMSGGWDSTAIFGLGRAALAKTVTDRQLLPVSISYPVGDPGREDELINDVANFWKSPIHWLDIHQIPLYREMTARAAETDEPPAHMYEPWNRALARGTRAIGSRVALDGNGGDQLFQVSDIYLSDLLKQGRLVELAREWKIKRPKGLRRLLRMTVEPILPSPLARAIAPISRSQNLHYLERSLPSWFVPDFARAHQLAERDRAVLPVETTGSRADAEARLYLTAPYWSYATSYMTGTLLQEGVETRSPLIDQRVVEFALRRPVSDRSSRRETKRLLRKAVQGTLPEHILAPRPYRTGITIGYSRREMRADFPMLLDRILAEPMRLTGLGVVNRADLADAVARFKQGDFSNDMKLYYTLNTELWLQAQTTMSIEPAMARPIATIA
jgi:asparagine synthase (glutamine-hydrolysing)